MTTKTAQSSDQHGLPGKDSQNYTTARTANEAKIKQLWEDNQNCTVGYSDFELFLDN
jgi:hypothetical protein